MTTFVAVKMSEKNKSKSISESIAKYKNGLISFIKKKVNTLEDAEDILQDVWYNFSKLSNIDELENVSAWLYNASRNKITDFYRKKKTLNLEDFMIETEDGEFAFKEVLMADDSHNPELKFFKDLFWEELMKSLNELPENQKQVFILNELEDKTLQEIADINEENIKTIISRKGYAVKHLRKKLEPLYLEFFSN